MMNLRKLLDTLSRSSAQAVSTLGNRNSSSVKDYLYIETDIEKSFAQALENLTSPNQIIFLCGSSGDGKSEILTRYHDHYQHAIEFHLDATHSFQPDKDAITTLDEIFTAHEASEKPLVIGINTGMLFNYSDRGSEQHNDLKQAIKNYLDGKEDKTQPSNFQFLNFEDFPKYKPIDDQILSPFIKELLHKLTVADSNNPFYVAWQNEVNGDSSKLHSNYRMLQQEAVQNVIIRTLLKLRLKNDYFLTARTILDFIHQLLTGPHYLFDNLFASQKTDLFKALRRFDPCAIRSREIDLFLIPGG